MLVFAILALATLGLSSAAFAHGLDVSASLFLPTDGDTMRDAGESSGFVELQITEEIGEICWDIEFEGIEESVDLIVRSAPENASGEQGEQPPLVMVATVTSGSADCVFRDIEATTEITLNVDAHIVELISMSNGDVLLRAGSASRSLPASKQQMHVSQSPTTRHFLPRVRCHGNESLLLLLAQPLAWSHWPASYRNAPAKTS